MYVATATYNGEEIGRVKADSDQAAIAEAERIALKFVIKKNSRGGRDTISVKDIKIDVSIPHPKIIIVETKDQGE